VRIGNLKISATRWPWQKYSPTMKYGWFGTGKRIYMARFGGGWKFKLGVDVGGSTVLFNLGFGIVDFRWETDADRARDAKFLAERAARDAERNKEKAGA